MIGSQECEFAIGSLVMRGQRWGRVGGQPILALHGWLDNCASFEGLAQRLLSENEADIDLVAVDLFGHGQSDHRPTMSAYNIWQDIAELLEVAALLGWKQFALVGHSRGAMISFLLSAIYPEKITSLTCIESLIPDTITEQKAPEQLRAAIDSVRLLSSRTNHYYSTFEDAVEAREKGLVKLSHSDAMVLAKRGVKRDANGYNWGNDPKLLAPSEVKFTSTQVFTFLDQLYENFYNSANTQSSQIQSRQEFRILFIVGNQGFLDFLMPIVEKIKTYPKIGIRFVDGDHHLHMSSGIKAVCQLLVRQLNL